MNTLSLYVQRNEEVISADSRSLISKRYCTVTSAMNREFWNITSDRQNSIYVGSYGRGTAIDTSDIDILMSLPESYYNQFNSVYGNGQSRLLQVVRQAILVRYPRSEVRADGQVMIFVWHWFRYPKNQRLCTNRLIYFIRAFLRRQKKAK